MGKGSIRQFASLIFLFLAFHSFGQLDCEKRDATLLKQGDKLAVECANLVLLTTKEYTSLYRDSKLLDSLNTVLPSKIKEATIIVNEKNKELDENKKTISEQKQKIARKNKLIFYLTIVLIPCIIF